MANYTALITAWNSVTQPPAGVTGTGLTAGMTTDQKLTAVNGWTVLGSAIPMVIPTYSVYNLIVPSEFTAATTANQQAIRDILYLGVVDSSPGTSIRSRFVSVFATGTTTFNNLANYAKQFDTPQIPWWKANGFSSVITGNDLVAAGLS